MAKTQPKKPAVVEIGDRVKFSINGFQGIVTSSHEFISGPFTFGVFSENPKTPKDDRIQQIDGGLLVVVKKGVIKAKPTVATAVMIGDRAKDRVSGFQGIVTGKHTYIEGCLQFTLTAEDNKIKEEKAIRPFDSARLEVIAKQAIVLASTGEPPGGPERYAPRARE